MSEAVTADTEDNASIETSEETPEVWIYVLVIKSLP